MSHVFISYAREDADYARRLKEALEQRNFAVWMDDHLHSGAMFPLMLEEQVNAAAALIVLMSDAARASVWVNNEVVHALEDGKPIFPLLLNGAPLFALRSINYIDVREGALPPLSFYDDLALVAGKQVKLPLLEWCDIPAGGVTIDYFQRPKAYTLSPYRISKFPVTNAQFEAFLNAPDGYASEDWWDFSVAARRWRNRHAEPLIVNGDADHPRVSVSWYEAMAFCLWLGHTLFGAAYRPGSDLPTVCLPTEQQWQRAGQGDDSRAFPWGNAFDKGLCNMLDSGYRHTTPVTQYPAGKSPFGVCDMVGNVWELCASAWDNDTITLNGALHRVVRGGDWNSGQNSARLTNRFGKCDPGSRANNVGFRLALLLPDESGK